MVVHLSDVRLTSLRVDRRELSLREISHHVVLNDARVRGTVHPVLLLNVEEMKISWKKKVKKLTSFGELFQASLIDVLFTDGVHRDAVGEVDGIEAARLRKDRPKDERVGETFGWSARKLEFVAKLRSVTANARARKRVEVWNKT